MCINTMELYYYTHMSVLIFVMTSMIEQGKVHSTDFIETSGMFDVIGVIQLLPM